MAQGIEKPEASITVSVSDAAAQAGLDVEPRDDQWWVFDSSRVSEAAYDPRNQKLWVTFMKPTPNRVEYVYDQVPPNVWRNLRRSQSPGRFVNRVLNSYPYHRVR